MKSISQLFQIVLLCSALSVQAQWTEHLLPETGNLTDVVFHGDRFFGSTYGQLYWSFDGKFWQKTGPSIPGNNDPVFIVEGARLFAFWGGQLPYLLMTSDTGQSWQTYAWSPSIIQTKQLLISGNTLLRVSDNDVFRSTDFGQNWQKTLSSAAPILIGCGTTTKARFLPLQTSCFTASKAAHGNPPPQGCSTRTAI